MNGTARNPFPGIRPFKKGDAEFFFGRDEHTYQLLRALRLNRFVAVLGSSGTGKSSLVRAGVLPPLEAGYMVPESGHWRIVTMRPGKKNHTANLAIELCTSDGWVPGADSDDINKALSLGGRGLIDVARSAYTDPDTRFLLLVDQFEEIFDFLGDPRDFEASDEAKAFIRLLLEAAADDTIPIYVVITMRSEFIGHCAAITNLTRTINDNLYLVPALDRTQLREVIEGPLRDPENPDKDISDIIEPGLVNMIINDTMRSSDKLPLLAHALNGLWKEWHNRVVNPPEGEPPAEGITHEHYRKIGGVANSLAVHLEKIFDEDLGTKQKEVAEHLFRHLAYTGPDGNRVRRPTTLKEVTESLVQVGIDGVSNRAAAEKELVAVIEVFEGDPDDAAAQGRSFLTRDKYRIAGRVEIDVAHETMFKQWPRLEEWLDLESHDVQLYEELKRATKAWEESGEDRGKVESGPRVVSWVDWRKYRAASGTALAGKALPEAVVDFLDECVAEARRARWLRRVPVYAVVLAVVVASLSLAFSQSRIATTQALAAERQQQSRDSIQALLEQARQDGELRDSINVSLTVQQELNESANIALTRSQNSLRATVGALESTVEEANRQTRAADAGRLALIAGDSIGVDHEFAYLVALAAVYIDSTSAGTVQVLREAMERSRVVRIYEKDEAPPSSSAQSLEVLRLALRGDSVRGWLADDAIDTVRDTASNAILVIHADSVTLISDGSGDSIPHARVTSAAFGRRDPSGDLFVITGSEDGEARLWSWGDSVVFRQSLLHDNVPVRSVAASGCGGRVATGTSEGLVTVWDSWTGQELVEFEDQHGGPVNSIAFRSCSRDGFEIVTGGEDRTVRVRGWSAFRSDPEPLVLRGHKGPVVSVAVEVDGRFVASASADGTLRIWNLSDSLTAESADSLGVLLRRAATSLDSLAQANTARRPVRPLPNGECNRLNILKYTVEPELRLPHWICGAEQEPSSSGAGPPP